MANENAVVVVTKLAAADLSSYQYYACYLSTDETVNVGSGYVYRPTGVLWNKPAAAGRGAQVCIAGETPAMLGATVTARQLLMPDATGRWIPRIAGWPGYAEAQEGGNVGEIRKIRLFGGCCGTTPLSP